MQSYHDDLKERSDNLQSYHNHLKAESEAFAAMVKAYQEWVKKVCADGELSAKKMDLTDLGLNDSEIVLWYEPDTVMHDMNDRTARGLFTITLTKCLFRGGQMSFNTELTNLKYSIHDFRHIKLTTSLGEDYLVVVSNAMIAYGTIMTMQTRNLSGEILDQINNFISKRSDEFVAEFDALTAEFNALKRQREDEEKARERERKEADKGRRMIGAFAWLLGSKLSEWTRKGKSISDIGRTCPELAQCATTFLRNGGALDGIPIWTIQKAMEQATKI